MPHRLRSIPFVPDGLASRWFVLANRVRNQGKRNTGRPLAVLEAPSLGDRHLYLLAEVFIQAGYFVHIVGGIRKAFYYHRDPYYFYVFSSENIKFVNGIEPGLAAGAVLCTERQEPAATDTAFSKVLRLSYDILLTPEEAKRAVLLPYPMHPNVYHARQVERIAPLRAEPKRMGVFFAGNLKEQYAQTTRLLRGMVPRSVAIGSLRERLGNRVRLFSSREALLHALETEDLIDSLVVFDATTARLGREEWFPVLAASRFFLALPGVVMPMCHNGVEAMALGVVPIIGYGHLFSPPLAPGEVCLDYASEHELAAAVETGLAMETAAYEALRARTMDHYDRQLSPAAFLDRLFRESGREIAVRFPAEFVSEGLAEGARPC